jgi:hypothetical protein
LRQWPCGVEASTALFHGADSGALPDKAAIKCLDSSIGRAADSRRLVLKRTPVTEVDVRFVRRRP